MMIIRTSPIFAFLVLLMIESAAGQALVKPGCPESCGNVSIPYPFGIGTGCYMSKGFELYCDNHSNPTRTILNSTKIEVMYFSLIPSFITVKLPTNRTNCARTWALLNLSGSPFMSVWSGNTLEEYALGVLEWAITDKDVLQLPHTNEGAFNCFKFNGPNDTVGYGYYNDSDLFSSYTIGNGYYNDAELFALYNLSSMSWNASQRCVCERGFEGNPYLPDGCHGELQSPLFL
ncbi:hypothetical protein SLEP1_g56302 [Rubroshorea leprosula]|uniref:Wall-associated receptor kinase galacturonan-binding domain-containing protein n=1 Tax=Rubroshorea leprosula TaxID=152421 RepID=A0AAV5MJ66_9ROSI|nr:hypothetical protein SLEP1_g56302 [Rubroshorea leprosula]